MTFYIETPDKQTMQFPLDFTASAITEKVLKETLCKVVQTANIILKQSPDFFTGQVVRNYIYAHLTETIEEYSIYADDSKKNNWCLLLFEFFKDNVEELVSPTFSPEKLTRTMFPQEVFEEIKSSIEPELLKRNLEEKYAKCFEKKN